MDELLQTICKALEPVLLAKMEEVIAMAVDKRVKQVLEVQGIEEFMPAEYFLNKYRFSYESFRRRLKGKIKVPSYFEGKHKVYNVVEFKRAHDAYNPPKPQFKRILKVAR